MPHAENDMSAPVTNGDKPSSQFISHLTSYPVVSDGIETFKSNPYGARSLDLAETTYTKFGKPVVPYLKTPYSYAAPYVAKADSLAERGLEQVDTHFPIVKEDTTTIKDTVLNYALFPFKVAGDGRDYVLHTWDDEYNKTVSRNNRGKGLSTSVLALISTQLKIASDGLNIFVEWVGPKKEEAKQKRDSLYDYVTSQKDNLSEDVKKKTSAYAEDAKKKKDAYAEDAKKKADKANEKKDTYAEKAQA